MPETNVTFAKIVANPTAFSWSQAYNAGKLFAVLSLERNEEEMEEKDGLNLLGKEILDNLEQEYFTLETKNLDSIKNAVLVTSKKIPEDVFCSFVICAIVDNLLYAFILGKGKVDVKREGKLGTILFVDEGLSSSVKAASGFLQNDDIIILQTKQFSDIVPVDTLAASLDSQPPSEIAETLAPKIHGNEKEQSGAAAIILSYKGPEESEGVAEEEIKSEGIGGEEVLPEEEIAEKETGEIPQAAVEVSSSGVFSKLGDSLSLIFAKLKLPKRERFSHSKKLLLTVAIIIAVIFAASIFLAIKKQNDEKTLALFNQIYTPAQKKYDEGQNLLSLNQNLAHDSFTASQKMLEDGKSKFPPKSKEEQQILALLEKVNQALSASSGVNLIKAQSVENSVSSILSAEIKNSGVSYVTQDDKNVYFADSSGISSQAKSGGNAKVIIKPGDLPKNIGGLGVYYGNVYVLDKDGKQINKFVQTSSGFGQANYFASETSPDLSNATSIAIDGSIWILFKDGRIEKFTKGKADTFSITGLDKGFSSPSRIYTTVDFDNVYILDQGNSRIVVLDKTGNYKAQYQADILKNASDFEVLEKDKKVYVLSSGKVYQIDLK
ncbi:MAG: hypothetical protein M1426_05085 [Patescibacteria group bacterium]|nr:hypothetical protein [Patescibacteria group bacterium]